MVTPCPKRGAHTAKFDPKCLCLTGGGLCQTRRQIGPPQPRQWALRQPRIGQNPRMVLTIAIEKVVFVLENGLQQRIPRDMRTILSSL